MFKCRRTLKKSHVSKREGESDSSSDFVSGQEPHVYQPDISTCNSGQENERIERVDNQITFFAEITPRTAGVLIRLIKEADGYLAASGGDEVHILVASGGGDAACGLMLYDLISSMETKTHVTVCGECCSAATMILCAADCREILPHSFIMMHEVSSSFSGTRSEMCVDLQTTQLLDDAQRAIYVENSRMTLAEVVTELSHDGFIGAQEALNRGLVDIVRRTRKRPTRKRGRKQYYSLKKQDVKQ